MALDSGTEGQSDFKPKEFSVPVFTTKDSGERATFEGGMVRDTAAGKMRPDLVRDGPMLLRWVMLMTRGAVKYAARNWMKAKGQDAFDRFMESADRHYNIWYTWRAYGINIEDLDNPTKEPLKEDHAAALYFNVNGAEYCDRVGVAVSAPSDNKNIWKDVPPIRNPNNYDSIKERLEILEELLLRGIQPNEARAIVYAGDNDAVPVSKRTLELLSDAHAKRYAVGPKDI